MAASFFFGCVERFDDEEEEEDEEDDDDGEDELRSDLMAACLLSSLSLLSLLSLLSSKVLCGIVAVASMSRTMAEQLGLLVGECESYKVLGE